MRTGSGRRLGMVEAMTLDPKRRLVLIKRDSVEHLVLLGASTELLIESNIQAGHEAPPPKAKAETGPGEERP